MLSFHYSERKKNTLKAIRSLECYRQTKNSGKRKIQSNLWFRMKIISGGFFKTAATHCTKSWYRKKKTKTYKYNRSLNKQCARRSAQL